MDSLSLSDPRRVPRLPLRPSWLAKEAMTREASIFESIEDLMDTWNAWADCVDKVFQQMGDQSKDLEVSDDEYISFVGMFASHPARPTRRPLKNITEHEDLFIRTMPHEYLARLQSLWTTYADKLEKSHVSMTAELGRCNLRASPFETTSTRGRLHGILRSMLGPGRSFQGQADTRAHEAMAVTERNLQGPWLAHTDQIVSAIEHMSLCGAPGIHMEVAEGLIVGLKKMSINAGTS